MAATARRRAISQTAPSTPSPAADFNLNDVIRGLAEVESDPYRITELLLEALTPKQKNLALLAALPNYVQRIARPSGVRSAGRISVKAPSSKWDDVKTIRGEIALLRASVFARGEWKFLGDCDRDDCADLAASREKRAADTQREAARYRELVTALKKRRARTVRDLPAEVVETIFNA